MAVVLLMGVIVLSASDGAVSVEIFRLLISSDSVATMLEFDDDVVTFWASELELATLMDDNEESDIEFMKTPYLLIN